MQALERVVELVDHRRGEAEARLVEHKQFRLAHRRAAERQHLPLAARQRAGALAPPLGQPRKEAEDALHQARDARFGDRGCAEAQVLLDGLADEQAPALGREREAARDDRMRGQARDRGAVPFDRPGARRHQSGDRIERRRLAGTVRAEQRHHAAGRDPQRPGGAPDGVPVPPPEMPDAKNPRRAHAVARCPCRRRPRYASITSGTRTTSVGFPCAIVCPWLKTSTRCASVMITSMMCSTITMVMPSAWMRRTSAIARWISPGVRPASASSSSMSFGSVASTRAISSRLRPGVPRLRARWSASLSSSVRRSTPVALATASARRGWRRKAPTMTFSRIVMSSNVAGTWKVRPMPSRAWVSADRDATSTPSKRMRPRVGARSPAMQLKNVDLPAPFGPISPTISPASTARSASLNARKPPKARLTSCASSSMGALRATRRMDDELLRQGDGPGPQLEQAARLEPRDQHDDAAVDNVGEAAAAAAEPGIGRALQRNQDDGADDRPVERAGAAGRRDDDHLHRHQDAEPALGVHEPDLEGIERAGARGERRAQHQRHQLGAPHRHAEAFRGALAGADRAQVIAEPAARHRVSDPHRDGEYREADVVVE